jgi:hypothetical protein
MSRCGLAECIGIFLECKIFSNIRQLHILIGGTKMYENKINILRQLKEDYICSHKNVNFHLNFWHRADSNKKLIAPSFFPFVEKHLFETCSGHISKMTDKRDCKDGKCHLEIYEKKRCATIRIPHKVKCWRKEWYTIEVPHFRTYYTEEHENECHRIPDCDRRHKGECKIEISAKKESCSIKIPHLEKYWVRERRYKMVPYWKIHYTEETRCACPRKVGEKKCDKCDRGRDHSDEESN